MSLKEMTNPSRENDVTPLTHNSQHQEQLQALRQPFPLGLTGKLVPSAETGGEVTEQRARLRSHSREGWMDSARG